MVHKPKDPLTLGGFFLFSNIIASMGAPVLNKKLPVRQFFFRCPFADLFRTTFPEIRGNRAQKDYLFMNLIEN